MEKAFLGLSLKKLLPIAGAAAGYFLGGPAGSAALNAALGSGIGTLVAGGDAKDAVMNAILAGGAGAGLGSMGIAGAGSEAAKQAALQQAAQQTAREAAIQQAGKQAAAEAAKGGIFGTGITVGDVIVGSSLLDLAGVGREDLGEAGEPQLESAPDYEGRIISGLFVDPETGIAYDTPEERDAAVEARRRLEENNMAMGGIVTLRGGGYIEGPGTGTSDSIKAGIYQNGRRVQEARLSDGEFVFKEKSVVGAGNGDRELGAKRLYAMMNRLERMA